MTVATLTIRNVSEAARRALKVRAARHNRSMEAEVRDILERAANDDVGFVGGWLERAEQSRGEDLQVPIRSTAREIDLR